MEGNEIADHYAKTAPGCASDAVKSYLQETSFAHMTRVTTEAKSRSTNEWITDHVQGS